MKFRTPYINHKHNTTTTVLTPQVKLENALWNKNLLAHFYLGHNIHEQGRDCLSYLLVISATSRPPQQPSPLPLVTADHSSEIPPVE